MDDISDQTMDNIITELDLYARNYNGYEYGLPTYGEHLEQMRNIIKKIINND